MAKPRVSTPRPPTPNLPADAPDPLEVGFKDLQAAAATLNVASNELAEPVSAIELAFKRLNIGVEAWVRFDGQDWPDGGYWRREIGYAKRNGRWGVALRYTSGNGNDPCDERVDSWLFNEAPRGERLRAIDHLPKLLDAMRTSALHTAGEMKKKLVSAERVAEVITTTAGVRWRK